MSDKWISVKVEMPEETGFLQTHLVLDSVLANCQAIYFGDGDWRVDIPLWDRKKLPKLHDVTHWRNLPDPPKEQS